MRALDEDLRDRPFRREAAHHRQAARQGISRPDHPRLSARSSDRFARSTRRSADTLLESELFGHVRGSFTGAYRDRPGLFELARGGTVLLDEVGEMSLRMQSLLLRFLETGEIQPVGSDRPRTRVDVRVIAMTNRRLVDQMAAKAFREDLYYRLNVIHIIVPPLRERREDVPALATISFRQSVSTLRRRAAGDFSRGDGVPVEYRWPGNVRELKNVTSAAWSARATA
jgi:transcriptional regulator with GAF, ATPase, and Fis domain